MAERPRDQLFFQIATRHQLTNTFLIWFIFFDTLAQIHLKLRILLRVVAEEKCFCWFDSAAEPRTEVIVVNTSLKALCMKLDHDFEQGEVKVLLFGGSEVLGKRLRRDISNMIVIYGEEGLSN